MQRNISFNLSGYSQATDGASVGFSSLGKAQGKPWSTQQVGSVHGAAFFTLGPTPPSGSCTFLCYLQFSSKFSLLETGSGLTYSEWNLHSHQRSEIISQDNQWPVTDFPVSVDTPHPPVEITPPCLPSSEWWPSISALHQKQRVLWQAALLTQTSAVTMKVS